MASKLPEESQTTASRWIKSVLDPHGYGLAIVIALVLHIVVIGLFAIEWPKDKRVVAEPTPRNIQAKVIQTESKKVKQQRLAKKKREEQRIKDENWKKHLAKKKAAKQKAAKKEKAKKDKAKKEKARKDKIKKENAKKALAKQKVADALKLKKAQELEEKLKEEQAFEREQEEALLEALADEEQQRSIEKALADEQLAQKNAAITDDIAAQIRAKISQAWRYPPSARPEMRVEVRIQLVPTGEVIDASLVTSSGNEALDRSVLAAVKRAEPLPVPKDSRLFEQQFRNFSMGFSPKDAVW